MPRALTKEQQTAKLFQALQNELARLLEDRKYRSLVCSTEIDYRGLPTFVVRVREPKEGEKGIIRNLHYERTAQ